MATFDPDIFGAPQKQAQQSGGFDPDIFAAPTAPALPAMATPKPKVNAAYEEGRRAPGWAQGLASVMNGPLMGFADEIGGAVQAGIDKMTGAPGTFGENYTARRDTLRGMQDQQREENPWVTGLTQAAASAPTLLVSPSNIGARLFPKVFARGASAVPAGVIANTGRAMLAGGGFGAVGGAGNSAADDAEGVAMDALKGGAMGVATGAIATPAIAAMGAGGRNVINRLSETSAASYAREKVAEALARDARGNVFASGKSDPVGQVAARLGKLGPDATIVDAAGRNTNQLLDTLATLPGRTKDTVYNFQRQRAAGVGDRLRESANEALGTNGARLASTIDDLVTTREAAAGPIYAQLQRVNVTPTQELTAIVEAADQLGAVKLAREIATARRQPFSIDTARPAGSSMMNTQTPPQWNMGQLDLVKQGVDQLLQSSKAIGKDGRLTPFGASLQRLNTQLKTELDNLTFDTRTGDSLYATARNAFAGPSALIDAANAGQRAITRDEATISGMLQGMGQSEREAFKVGAFEALRAKLGTQGGQTQIMNMWKEPTTREKLQVIFGDERSFREFASATARESVKKRIQSVGQGSQTAGRQAGMGDLDAAAMTDAASMLANAKGGNVLGVLGSARNAWGRVATPQTVRDEMGRLLLQQGPAARTTVNELGGLIGQINRNNGLLADSLGITGGLLGSNLAPSLPLGLIR